MPGLHRAEQLKELDDRYEHRGEGGLVKVRLDEATCESRRLGARRGDQGRRVPRIATELRAP